MLTFTKEMWKSLPSKQKWDILVALRGPDSEDGERLKWFTTGVIRATAWKLFKPSGGSAITNDQMDFVLLPAGFNLPIKSNGDHLGTFSAAHFFQHVYEAALIMNIPIAYIDPQLYADACRSSQFSALELIYAAPSTPKIVRETFGKILGKKGTNE